jgi:hypothetical protein
MSVAVLVLRGAFSARQVVREAENAVVAIPSSWSSSRAFQRREKVAHAISGWA